MRRDNVDGMTRSNKKKEWFIARKLKMYMVCDNAFARLSILNVSKRTPIIKSLASGGLCPEVRYCLFKTRTICINKNNIIITTKLNPQKP